MITKTETHNLVTYCKTKLDLSNLIQAEDGLAQPSALHHRCRFFHWRQLHIHILRKQCQTFLRAFRHHPAVRRNWLHTRNNYPSRC